MISSGRVNFDLNYQISPITLVGGLASNMPSGKMPISALTQPGAFPQGVLASPDDDDLDGYFAHFVPLAGATLIDQALGDYPLANQQVAANSVIEQPLVISMMMIAPAQFPGDYVNKQAVMSALKSSLDQHNLSGGLYNVATPAYLWQNCILKQVVDATPEGDTKQRQVMWRFDFVQPLVTLAAAQAAQNSLMQKLTAGCPVVQPADGSPISYSSLSSAVGDPLNPSTGSVVPAAQNLISPAVTSASSVFSTGVVNAASALGSAVTAATSTALASFNLSRVVQGYANQAVKLVGSSIAGIVQTASNQAVRAAQSAALGADIPGIGLLAAQFSSHAAQTTVDAATQALQRGISAQVGPAGTKVLQSLLNSAQGALAGAATTVEEALSQ